MASARRTTHPSFEPRPRTAKPPIAPPPPLSRQKGPRASRLFSLTAFAAAVLSASAVLGALTAALLPGIAAAQSPDPATLPVQPEDATAAHCRLLAEGPARLACYDNVFGPPAPPGDAPPTSVPTGTRPSPNEGRRAPVTTPPLDTSQSIETLSVAGAMDRLWELTPETRRRRFVVRTYQPNYLLPVHVSNSLNRTPHSPTRGSASTPAGYMNTEAALQVSLRTKVLSDLLLPDDSLWFAYTQKSTWQVWNHEDSAPFRDTDYQPEVIYTTRVADRLGDLPGDWRLRLFQLGIAHQSNGQTDPLSRSWNRVYATLGFERGEFGLFVQPYYRLPESKRDDDNPDLTSYVGKLELRAVWFPGRATAMATARVKPGTLNRGSLQLDFSYPLSDQEPLGLRWYLQLFSGYGETLLDYNHRQTSLGLGFMLFQF